MIDNNLLHQAKSGNKVARETFLEKNRPLVVYVARRFSQNDYEDLIQAGFVGLIQALDRFDASYGTAFSTYAVPLIMGEIKEWLRKEKQAGLGKRARTLYLRYKEASERYYKLHGKEPSLAEVAKILKVDREELIYALEMARTPRSLDEPLDAENQTFFKDIVAGKEESSDTRLMIDEMLGNLDERSRYIIIQRFFAEKTQVELAAELQISQAQICRIEKKALHILRKFLGDDKCD